MRKFIIVSIAAVIAFCGCEKEGTGTPEPDNTPGLDNKFLNRCNYENVKLTFHPSQVGYEIVNNPSKDDVNKTRKCAKVTSVGGNNEFIWCDTMPRKLDFTRNAPIFKIKVMGPKAGAQVGLKLEHPDNYANNPKSVTAVTTKAGQWEELVFDFTDQKPANNFYQKVVLTFDWGKAASGDVWYFDEILCPSDDLTDICLFQRYEKNPVFTPGGAPSWRNQHMANAGIISPADSPDGNWWM